MTECQSDVMRLGCGASRKKVGQVGNWLQLEGPDFVHPCMHRCSAKRPSLSAFQSNWGRFQKPAGMKFSPWQSCRWVANIGNLGNQFPTNPRAKTSTLTENCTWLAGKTASLCVQKSRRARVESTTVSQRTRTRSSDLIVKNWLRNIFVGL